MTAQELRAALACTRGSCPCQRRGTKSHCPSHSPDRNPSLDVTERGGRILVKCRAACTQRQVLDALRARGLWPAPATPRPPRPRTLLEEAREQAATEAERQRFRLAPYRQRFLLADDVRLAHRAAGLARKRATTLGGGAAGRWRLLELAAEAEREAWALEAWLDAATGEVM
jgi:hypothetical protein